MAALFQVPGVARRHVAQHHHRHVAGTHRPEEAELIAARFDGAQVEDEVAAADQLGKGLGIGGGKLRIGGAGNDMHPRGRHAKIVQQLLRLGVGVRQQQIDALIEPPPPRAPGRARPSVRAAGRRPPIPASPAETAPGRRCRRASPSSKAPRADAAAGRPRPPASAPADCRRRADSRPRPANPPRGATAAPPLPPPAARGPGRACALLSSLGPPSP